MNREKSPERNGVNYLSNNRRGFIGGSDARIIMGEDEGALIRLWREKRGEVEPKDLSGNLVVQLGLATEDLNRRWYEANTGQVITDVQKRVFHPTLRWMAATLDCGFRRSRPGITGYWRPGFLNDAAHRNGMMPPGSRASLADGFVSPATTFGQAFWFCLPRVRRMLSPTSSMRWAL